MSQSASNQVVPANSFTAGTALAVTAPQYYERVIVTNQAATADLYVSTNGQPASTSAGGFGGVVLPGAWRMIGNDQPRQPLVTQAEGATVQNTGYQGAITPNLNPLASGHPTVVSLLFPASSTPGAVGLEFV